MPNRRPDASMTLLTETMERPLDAGYAEAAARELEGTRPVSTPRRMVLLIVALALGIGVGVAVRYLHNPVGQQREARQFLEQQILSRTEQITEAQYQAVNLAAEISGLQESVLALVDPALGAQLAVDELTNGTTAVEGPGLVITLTDGGGGLAEVLPDNLVRDHDLQVVVQGLWAAGAEAIAIGEQRLTMTTAIRNAGDAVLVDLVPVLGPVYQVTAIGDPVAMEAAWNDSDAAVYLGLLGAEFGIRSLVSRQAELTIPGASGRTLRHAGPLAAPGMG
ncbi:MAG: DUF881 domain-containing protein [Promicromonosporaceae bacterium]|nr:DUF881 domain-containing protein [Promicromonosporaceae bacterium]